MNTFKHVTYTKIQSIYKRDEKGNFIIGVFSCPEFDMLFNAKWKAYQKIDGTNISYYWNGHELRIDGKTENAQTDKEVMNMLKKKITAEMLSKAFPPKYDENGTEKPFNVIIYGEAYGKKIQKVGSRFLKDGHDFRIFDILIVDSCGKKWWLETEVVEEICNSLGVEMPVSYGVMTLAEAEKMVIKGWEDPIAEDSTLPIEGLVLRPVVQLFNKKGERVMVKVKTCDYRKIGING